MYYRRWTRMYIMPALKYYTKYGVIDNQYNIYKPIFNNIQNPLYFQPKRRKLQRSARQKDLDTKLIEKLFLKYPDLKYQSIGKSQYRGDRLSGYSYAHAFLTEQKRLMHEGYGIDIAFEMVEKKFHQKFQRKIDQTLLSRGLAIGNRARSFMTVYQQQIQFEGRLKTMRTKRQVQKYKQKLQKVRQRVQRQNLNSNDEMNGQVMKNENDKEYYTRMFVKISQEKRRSQEKNLQEMNRDERTEKIDKIEKEFKNMFSQFYERAAYKDRLQGLTDEQIKKEILASPRKIKNQTRQLIQYLRNKVGVYLNQNGQMSFTDPNIDKNLKEYLLSTPKIKIAMLNEELGFEKPLYVKTKAKSTLLDQKKIITSEEPNKVGKQDWQMMRRNKKEQLQDVLSFNEKVPIDRRAYRIFQSEEERLIRLELKYINRMLATMSKSQDTEDRKQFDLNIPEVVKKFRRLKFRAEKRFRQTASQQLDLLFSEHSEFKDLIDAEDEVEFQSLIEYLRKKDSQRRLTSIDQAVDMKINQLVNPQVIPEVAGVSNILKDQHSMVQRNNGDQVDGQSLKKILTSEKENQKQDIEEGVSEEKWQNLQNVQERDEQLNKKFESFDFKKK